MPRLAPALLLLAAPALLAAQERAPSAGAARPTRAPAATPDSSPTARRAAAFRGIEPGHLLLGARTWVGINSTVSLGASGEVTVTRPGSVGPGLITAGAAIDAYQYSQNYGALGSYSLRVIPIGGFANYHFPLANRRFDPYAGIGLGYALVSASARVDGEELLSGTRSSSAFTFGQLGARYFVSPSLAVQAQTGWGLGALSVGVSWKR